jgi:hypothetical protein
LLRRQLISCHPQGDSNWYLTENFILAKEAQLERELK